MEVHLLYAPLVRIALHHRQVAQFHAPLVSTVLLLVVLWQEVCAPLAHIALGEVARQYRVLQVRYVPLLVLAPPFNAL